MFGYGDSRLSQPLWKCCIQLILFCGRAVYALRIPVHDRYVCVLYCTEGVHTSAPHHLVQTSGHRQEYLCIGSYHLHFYTYIVRSLKSLRLVNSTLRGTASKEEAIERVEKYIAAGVKRLQEAEGTRTTPEGPANRLDHNPLPDPGPEPRLDSSSLIQDITKHREILETYNKEQGVVRTILPGAGAPDKMPLALVDNVESTCTFRLCPFLQAGGTAISIGNVLHIKDCGPEWEADGNELCLPGTLTFRAKCQGQSEADAEAKKTVLCWNQFRKFLCDFGPYDAGLHSWKTIAAGPTSAEPAIVFTVEGCGLRDNGMAGEQYVTHASTILAVRGDGIGESPFELRAEPGSAEKLQSATETEEFRLLQYVSTYGQLQSSPLSARQHPWLVQTLFAWVTDPESLAAAFAQLRGTDCIQDKNLSEVRRTILSASKMIVLL